MVTIDSFSASKGSRLQPAPFKLRDMIECLYRDGSEILDKDPVK
jgi:hypothetical protein